MKRIINMAKNIKKRVLKRWWDRSLQKKAEKMRRVLLHMAEDSRLMDDFLELLLNMMRLMFYLDIAGYREQIQDFKGAYTFGSKDGKIACGAIFENGEMKVKRREVPDYDIKIVFRDGRALGELMLSGSLDVLEFMLDGRISPHGNLNYLLKFAYMVMHLQSEFNLRLPQK